MVRDVVISVHHLEASRSTRVLWMLEELELPYEIVSYARDPKTMLAPKALEAVHPLGKSPVLVDGDVTVAESGAILEYLVETYGKGAFVPAAATQAFRDYRYFMHYAEGSLMPYLLLKLIFKKIATAPMPFFARPVAKQLAKKIADLVIDPNLKRHVGFLAQHLATHAWFAGAELTAADIQMSYPIEALVERAGSEPALESWLAKVHARPAYQRAIAKGGPVMIDG